MITKIELVPRKELHCDYVEHQAINAKIASDFKISLQNFDPEPGVYAMPLTNEKILHMEDYENTPYGPTTTLAKSGCAVFCLEHGLRVKGVETDIADLAKEVYEKGYYEPGKGTFHNLFDNYKNGFCTRCSSYNEVFRALGTKNLVTLLVDNQGYYNDETKTGRHFINVIGKQGAFLVIEDSNTRPKIVKSAADVFKSTVVAWRWN